jgi:hypothetical protein
MQLLFRIKNQKNRKNNWIKEIARLINQQLINIWEIINKLMNSIKKKINLKKKIIKFFMIGMEKKELRKKTKFLKCLMIKNLE